MISGNSPEPSPEHRTYKLLSDYYSFAPATSLSISQRGLLGVATGPHVTIWKDALRTKQTEPYMKHLVPGTLVSPHGQLMNEAARASQARLTHWAILCAFRC
jgi:hypothetical protein